MIKRLFIRFILKTKKTNVPTAIHGMPINRKFKSNIPKISPRVMLTTCVSGKTAKTTACAVSGKRERGKKVLLRNVIGVTSKKEG